MVNGIEVSTLSKDTLRNFQKNIGMIFQNFALLERRTVYQNIALPMKSWGMKKSEIDVPETEMERVIAAVEKRGVAWQLTVE